MVIVKPRKKAMENSAIFCLFLIQHGSCTHKFTEVLTESTNTYIRVGLTKSQHKGGKS